MKNVACGYINAKKAAYCWDWSCLLLSRKTKHFSKWIVKIGWKISYWNFPLIILLTVSPLHPHHPLCTPTLPSLYPHCTLTIPTVPLLYPHCTLTIPTAPQMHPYYPATVCCWYSIGHNDHTSDTLLFDVIAKSKIIPLLISFYWISGSIEHIHPAIQSTDSWQKGWKL